MLPKFVYKDGYSREDIKEERNAKEVFMGRQTYSCIRYSFRAFACRHICHLSAEVRRVRHLHNTSGYKTKHVFIVVMDGVRYSETFGDSTHALIPHLYNDLKPEGTLFTNFYNRGITVTRQGHSTLISGTWQSIPNGGPRLTRPTLFEYYRDEKGVPPTKCWSIFGKGPYAFEPYSSHPAYGNRFAGQYINGGGRDNPLSEDTAEGNVAVLSRVIEVMKKDQPDIVFINFGYHGPYCSCFHGHQ